MVPERSSGLALRDEVNAAPQSRGAIAARRGFDLSAPFRSFRTGASGRATIQGEELDRFELALGDRGSSNTSDLNVGPAGDRHFGYLRVGDDLGPLPIGSHLDEATGVFTWAPGVGFVHGYDLVFVRWTDGCAVARQEVRLVLNPKGSNRVGPQVVIDTPAAQDPGSQGSRDRGAQVTQPFLVAGWALDLADEVGTGVDTLHVWAYPASACGPRGESESSSTAARASAAPRAVKKCGDPIFVGATSYGGARPDVGAIFGDRFTNSGYGIIVDTLPPGTYDLAVFAWSTATGGFVPAKVVRVTLR